MWHFLQWIERVARTVQSFLFGPDVQPQGKILTQDWIDKIDK